MLCEGRIIHCNIYIFFTFPTAIAKSPLFIRPHSKAVLLRAIHRDTEFLARHMVMDYSLLLGIEEDTSKLVVGIIGNCKS